MHEEWTAPLDAQAEEFRALLGEPAARTNCPASEAEMSAVPWPEETGQVSEPHETFIADPEAGFYELATPQVKLTLDRLRRCDGDVIGEMTVRGNHPLAGRGGILSFGVLNLGSVRARTERARLLERFAIKGVNWTRLLEQFVFDVIEAERRGSPAIDLRTAPLPENDGCYHVAGFRLPKRFPGILFGDGGSAKSLIVLHLAGLLAQEGVRVAYFDWELDPSEHRRRLELMFGPMAPKILYCRCERPLSAEADRLRRVVREERIDYAIYDSVGMATDGPPEAAEAANRYMQAARYVGCGGLHVAHVAKDSPGKDPSLRPFGSTFWHNGARATWHVRGDQDDIFDSVEVLITQRKNNLGRLQAPFGFRIRFFEDRIEVRKSDPGENENLSQHLPVRVRMIAALKRGPLSLAALAEEAGAEADTVRRTARRYSNLFVTLPDGRLGLKERS
jgi:hypothetical protein